MTVEAINKLSEVREIIEGLRDELQDKFDNLGERAQENEKGEALSECASSLDDLCGTFEDVEHSIDLYLQE